MANGKRKQNKNISRRHKFIVMFNSQNFLDMFKPFDFIVHKHF